MIKTRRGDTREKQGTSGISVAAGFYPSTGNRKAMEVVLAHEVGRLLTDVVGVKMRMTKWAKKK